MARTYFHLFDFSSYYLAKMLIASRMSKLFDNFWHKNCVCVDSQILSAFRYGEKNKMKSSKQADEQTEYGYEFCGDGHRINEIPISIWLFLLLLPLLIVQLAPKLVRAYVEGVSLYGLKTLPQLNPVDISTLTCLLYERNKHTRRVCVCVCCVRLYIIWTVPSKF